MRCSKCETEGISGKRFCAECGSPLLNHCSNCNSDNPPDAKFCADCGNPLNTPGSPSVSATSAVLAQEVAGERRHLTILFCDLVGSTTLAAQLDPEEWRATVAGYQDAAAEAITRFGGEVERYIGDGIMAFFGYPTAHDNDAERAARAGLAILDAIAQLDEQPTHTKLSVRIGIDSGRVVVGAGGGKEVDAFGDAANIAARVRAAAEPGTLMISDATQRLVSGLFIVEDRGAQALKGIARPVRLFHVIRPSGMHGRFEAMIAAGGLTPFVGREEELRSLQSRWERVLEGEGQVALISGEAGIGKSRLVQRFHEQIAGTPHTWIETGAGAFFQNTPFHPISEMLRQFLGDAAAPDQIAALAPRLTAVGLEPTEALPLIAPLLNLPLPPEYPPLASSPEQQRRRLLATLVEWVLGSARVQPLVSVIEDLHWIDPSTLELIELLVEQGVTAPLLLLYTARPEFRVPWATRAHHTQITLSRLSARHVRTMVGEVAAQKALSDATIATVVERTSGVPLFVEELTRAVLESGDGKLSGREIPATLHDSLMARLDRLGPAKEVIQVGAVLGSDFSYELLHAIHPIADADLQRALRSLTDAELLYIRGIAPEATYRFKHALIRDAAYEALLKSRRKELHLIVARTIDEKFPAFKEAHPEVLARHWTEAGEADPAIIEWQRAGARAVERRAYREAEQHYREALAILIAQEESPERDTRELILQLALGEVSEATLGWSAAKTAQVYERAKSLAERAGVAESVQIFYGSWSAAHTQGKVRAALALADQMLVIARRVTREATLVIAHYAQGNTRLFLADLVSARDHFGQAMRHYRAEDFRGNPIDLGVRVLSWAAINEWYLGYPDTALKYSNEAIALARRQNNLFDLAWSISLSVSVHNLRGDSGRALEACGTASRLSAESGFALLKTLTKIREAWTRAQIGETIGAPEAIQAGLSECDSQKFYLARPNFLRMLGEAQTLAGRIEDAFATGELALECNPDELIYRPCVLALHGKLQLCHDSPSMAQIERAERDFREAIELARGTSAKSDELRATISLARLIAKQGRRDEARTRLAEIYTWFTEGFDTADLKDARALLDELGR